MPSGLAKYGIGAPVTPPMPSGLAKYGISSGQQPNLLAQASPNATAFQNDLTKGLLQTASTIGTVLQPLQAPQQVVLGAVAEAQGNTGALGRGLGAAAGFLTYGAAEGIPGLADARRRYVRGAEIAKAMGADDQTATWTGLGIDILGDPATLLGGVGLVAKGGAAAAKVSRLGGLAAKLDTAGAAILRTSAQVERSTNAFRGVAQGITQGVGAVTLARAGRLGGVLADARQAGTITGALAEIRPAFREAALQTAWDNVLGKELDVSKVPFFTGVTGAKRASVAELLVPEEILRRVAPIAEVKKLEFARELRLQGNLLQAEFVNRTKTSLDAFKTASAGLGRKEIDELDGILSRIMDAPDRAANRLARDELAALGQRVGKPDLEQQGLAALAAGIRLDVWGGQQLARVGVFSKEGLLENLAFESGTRRTVGGDWSEVPGRLNPSGNPRRGLRRLYGLMEDPEAHIQKVLAMQRPSVTTFDPAKLEGDLATALRDYKITPVPGAAPRGGDLLRGDQGGAVDWGAAVDTTTWRNQKISVDYQAVDVDAGAGFLAGLDRGNRMRLQNSLRAFGNKGVIAKRANGNWGLKQPDGTFASSITMPLNHPVIGSIVDDADILYFAGQNATRSVVTAKELRAVPNWWDESSGVALDDAIAAHQNAITQAQGVAWVHSDDISRVLPNATAQENAAITDAITSYGMGGSKGDMFPVPLSDTRLHPALMRSTDPQADVLRRMAEQRAAKDRAFLNNFDPPAITATIKATFDANPNVTLGDILASVQQKHNLDGQRLAKVMDTLNPNGARLRTVADLPGVKRVLGSDELAEVLRNRLLEPGGGAGGTGSMAVGVGNFTARKNLSQELRDNYGQLDSFRAQIVDQVQTAARGVVNKNALLETRQFLEAEGLIYSRLPQRIAEGTADASKLPAAVLNRPTVATGVQKPGWRTLTSEETSGLGGVFQAGDVVPDWAHRTLTVGNKAGIDMPAVLDWGVRNWKASKLGNFSTIAVNVMSGIVQAEQYGIGPIDLARGFMQYLNRGAKGERELLNAGIGLETQLSAEFTREAAQIIKRMGGADKAKNPIEYIGRVIDEVTGARVGALGDDPLAKILKYSPGRNLLQIQSMSETALKGAVYYAAKGRGVETAAAGHLAQEALFDYAARPLFATFLSRTGIQPFATFSTFSFWRTLQNLYERPFRTARLYRAADSLKEDSDKVDKELAVARDFIKEKLPVRIFEDGEGRGWYVPLQALLPEGAVTDLVDDTNAQNLFGKIPVPPAFSLVQALSTGVGFQGQNIYQGLGQRGGGANSVDAFKNNPVEAGRRVLKQLWQFGVSPWMPGQPQTERLARAIAQAAEAGDQIELKNNLAPGSLGGGLLRFLEDGPAGTYGEGADSVNPTARNGEGATPLPLALGRFAGIRSYQVQGDVNQPGAAQSALLATKYQFDDRQTYWKNRIRTANPADRQRLVQEATLDLRQLAQQIQQKRQQLTGGR
jgi:hypothetical protein